MTVGSDLLDLCLVLQFIVLTAVDVANLARRFIVAAKRQTQSKTLIEQHNNSNKGQSMRRSMCPCDSFVANCPQTIRFMFVLSVLVPVFFV